MTVRISIVLDCEDPSELAPFWCDALGYKEVFAQEPYVVLAGGDVPKLVLQRVPEPKTVKNRVHFDLHPDVPIEDEAKRLEGLGAMRIDAGGLEGTSARWIVMEDPAGNEFCVCET